MLRVILTLACLPVLLNVSIGYSQTRPIEDTHGLSTSTASFFSAWLVERDVRKAMHHVSFNLVLGKCDLPPHYTQIPRSATRRRKIVELVLSSTLRTFPKYGSLNMAITPSTIPAADWFETVSTRTVQIIHIKPGQEGSIMCKFEEGAAYRKAMLRPSVYYVGMRINNPKNSDLADWMTAWIKERGQWRLISIELLED